MPTYQEHLFAQHDDDGLILLVTISHEDLADPIRVAQHPTNITSNGDVFVAYNFDIELPTEDPDRIPVAQLRIDNTDLLIIDTIRSISSAPTVKIQIVRLSDPDTVEVTLDDFKFTGIQYDAQTIQGQLTLEEFLQEPYPAASFDPARFPGGF